MNREIFFFELIAAFCGLLIWVAGARPSPEVLFASGRAAERRAWRQLWLPMAPALFGAALFTGWLFQEPDLADEWARPLLTVAALVFFGVWVRASIRSFIALDSGELRFGARTIGVIRTRVQIEPAFASALDPEALAAVIAHENAHARHRDPLRIVVAQFLTDLQWPAPAATNRFAFWLYALEFARDEEARDEVEGEDLAAAVLVAARRGCVERQRPAAAFLSDSDAMRERIRRLLAPRSDDLGASGAGTAITLSCGFFAMVVFGATAGESIIRALPGVGH